jgi:hypothetical protein
MVEVHNKPDRGNVGWTAVAVPDQFDELMEQVRQIAAVVGGPCQGLGLGRRWVGAGQTGVWAG